MPERLLLFAGLLASLAIFGPAPALGAVPLQRVLAIGTGWCAEPLSAPDAHLMTGEQILSPSPALSGAVRGATRHRFEVALAFGHRAHFDMILQSGEVRRVRGELWKERAARPLALAMLQLDGQCRPTLVRRLVYAPDRDALSALEHLSPDLGTVLEREELDPEVPPGEDPGGVTVAHADSGVNYLLPHISGKLARDDRGRALGYDYWDEDDRPFDLDTSRSPFFPLRHGTAVASILLREAPEVRLLPYRYPRGNLDRMAALVRAAADKGARVVMMPLGSSDASAWEVFRRAAEAHRDILFVVSAGNDGRDIDLAPIYPASFSLENLLVVTSADVFGRLAQGSNWGRQTVDLMVPGEAVETIDHRGARVEASGSSFAVPRVAALAARLLAAHPGLSVSDLLDAIRARTARGFGVAPDGVRWGWIPNPADDGG